MAATVRANIPMELYEKLVEVGQVRGISAEQVLRTFIKVGLILNQLDPNPEASFQVRADRTGQAEAFTL